MNFPAEETPIARGAVLTVLVFSVAARTNFLVLILALDWKSLNC